MIFGRAPDGREVRAFDLRDDGISARVIEWGAVLQDLRVDGVDRSLVLSFSDLDGYLGDTEHIGAVVGRVANRLSGGRFSVEGREHRATRNIGGRDTLHGGARGWGRRCWTMLDATSKRVVFRLRDPDGAEGFPGAVDAQVVYAVRPHALEVSIFATARAATVLNPTHHHYFNLSGERSIDAHELELNAGRFTALDARLMPTGELANAVGETDWRRARRIGAARLDLNYCLADQGRAAPERAATLSGGGVAMTVLTTAPGLQVYSGDNLPPGGRFSPRAGMCLEPQFWPDAPNNPGFPSIEIAAGARLQQTTRFVFAKA
ncbi:MAG: aldose epimerase family protein [Pseudomonadota bacterium]